MTVYEFQVARKDNLEAIKKLRKSPAVCDKAP